MPDGTAIDGVLACRGVCGRIEFLAQCCEFGVIFVDADVGPTHAPFAIECRAAVQDAMVVDYWKYTIETIPREWEAVLTDSGARVQLHPVFAFGTSEVFVPCRDGVVPITHSDV